MLRFLVAVLISLHLSCGENLSVEPDVGKSRRFTFGDGEYEISALRLDWYTARNFCKIQGGQLLSIESQAENMAVLQALGDYTEESVWTSGSDIEAYDYFYWDSTGAPFENFTFWAPGEPDTSNTENCVRLNATLSHMWSDADCDLLHFSICEFHPCSDKVEQEKDVAGKTPLLRFTFENGTYEVSDERQFWVDAKNACKLKGMELVSIETFEENVAILNAIVSLPTSHFWTSGTTMGHEDNFYWEATGHAVGPYTGWGPGEPNVPSLSTSILLDYASGHMWSESLSRSELHYICELQPCKSPNSNNK